MSRFLEFIANHPMLSAAAAALIGLIVAYELRHATRGYRSVEAADAPRLINHDDAVVLDVRAQDAYRKSRILHAVNVPAGDVGEKEYAKYADRAVIVYDDNGVAATRVAAQLAKGGCKHVYLLQGGFAAWQSAGLPTAK